jgi:hypothetical protein
VTDAGVRIVGLNRFVTTMRKAGADMDELKDAHRRAGDIVANEARTRAPRRTGRLSSSIRPARQVRRTRIMAGGAATRYAGPIHWGWPARRIGAQPFLVDAAHATEPRWLPAYLDDVEKALAQVKGD